MNVKNSELRIRARVTLGGKIFGRQWLMGLAVSFVASALVSAASSITGGIGSIILTGPFMFGLYLTFLNAVRTKEDITFDFAFDGFKNFAQALLLGLMQAIFVMLWSFLFVIPGIIKSYSYSMAYYIMADHPEYDWRQCIDESKKLMKGKKWKLFCLDLSFIGWYIVGALCLGVGMLLVSPYHYMAHTEFYNELVGHKAPEEAPTTEEAPADYI